MGVRRGMVTRETSTSFVAMLVDGTPLGRATTARNAQLLVERSCGPRILKWVRADLTGIEAYTGEDPDRPAPPSVWSSGSVVRSTLAPLAVADIFPMTVLAPAGEMAAVPSLGKVFVGCRTKPIYCRVTANIAPSSIDAIVDLTDAPAAGFFCLEPSTGSFYLSGSVGGSNGAILQILPNTLQVFRAITNPDLDGEPLQMAAAGARLYCAVAKNDTTGRIAEISPVTGVVSAFSTGVDMIDTVYGLAYDSDSIALWTSSRAPTSLLFKTPRATLITPAGIAAIGGYTVRDPQSLAFWGGNLFVSDVDGAGAPLLASITAAGALNAQKTFTGLGAPGQVGFDGTNVYVSVPSENKVYKLHPTTLATLGTIEVGGAPYGCLVLQ